MGNIRYEDPGHIGLPLKERLEVNRLLDGAGRRRPPAYARTTVPSKSGGNQGYQTNADKKYENPFDPETGNVLPETVLQSSGLFPVFYNPNSEYI